MTPCCDCTWCLCRPLAPKPPTDAEVIERALKRVAVARNAELAEMARLRAENADLRDRLALCAEHVCQGCGCAAADLVNFDTDVCGDCLRIRGWRAGGYTAACISVGLRALAGRKILEGVSECKP